MFETLKSFFRGDTAKVTGKYPTPVRPDFSSRVINLTGERLDDNRVDGWMNILNGLGVRGRDKTTAICFRSCIIFSPIELDELYRADGLTKRIIDIVPAEMLRQGFEIDGDPEGEVLGKFEELDVN